MILLVAAAANRALVAGIVCARRIFSTFEDLKAGSNQALNSSFVGRASLLMVLFMRVTARYLKIAIFFQSLPFL